MKKYIWQNSEFPNLIYDKDIIIPFLSSVRLLKNVLHSQNYSGLILTDFLITLYQDSMNGL